MERSIEQAFEALRVWTCLAIGRRVSSPAKYDEGDRVSTDGSYLRKFWCPTHEWVTPTQHSHDCPLCPAVYDPETDERPVVTINPKKDDPLKVF